MIGYEECIERSVLSAEADGGNAPFLSVLIWQDQVRISGHCQCVSAPSQFRRYFMNSDHSFYPRGQAMFLLRRIVRFLVAIVVCCVPCSAWAGNLLQNGGFDTPTPGLSGPNYPTSFTGTGFGGPSSAADWTLYNGYPATTSTELLQTTDPNGSGFMIHVTSVPTTSNSFAYFNGLEQAFPAQSGGVVTVSVDVEAVQGPVFVGLFANDGGTLLPNYVSIATIGQWETVTFTVPAGTTPSTEPDLIAIYAYNGTAGATGEFYADNANAMFVPEPSSGLMALIGMSATALWVRKTRPRLGRRLAEHAA
jgi:hypothetical protein